MTEKRNHEASDNVPFGDIRPRSARSGNVRPGDVYHGDGRVGVLLVNTGTPAKPTPSAVRAYLRRFLSDPRIVPMPKPLWSVILNVFILPGRSRRSAKHYELIWTTDGSPLMVAYESLVRGMNDYYHSRGLDVVVCAAMSYSKPFIPEGLKTLREAGCSRIVVLPMYPQSAFSTVGAVRDKVDSALARSSFEGTFEFIDNYHDNPTYIKAIAASLLNAGFEVQSDDQLLFSYHSIPLKDIEQGDTYELQTSATSLAVARELGLDRKRWTIAYQSRFDKRRSWLSPFVRRTLDRWAHTAPGRVFMICPNFSVDCLETLYEIQLNLEPEYLRNRAQYHPGLEDGLIYVPCLGKSKAHLKVLVDVLRPYVER